MDTKYYIVCCQPRSGTHFLRSLLKGVGVGDPDEYFPFLRNTLKRHAERSIHSIETLYKKGTINNVWGASVHQKHYKYGIRRLKEMSGLKDADDLEVLNNLFPGVKFIYLYRLDKIKQAISFVKMHQTHSHPIAEGKGEWVPKYTPEDIQQAILGYAQREAKWQKFFTEYNITPHFVTYESLCEDKVAVMSGILDFLGIELSQNISLAERISEIRLTRRLWDDVNESWYERFMEEQDWI